MNAMLYLPLNHSASPDHPTVPNEPEPIHTPAATVAPAHVENVASSPASVPTRGDQPRSLFAALAGPCATEGRRCKCKKQQPERSPPRTSSCVRPAGCF